MRAAIKARTEDLGIEKSKVSADYIASKQAKAQQAGSAAAAGEDSNSFAGLDLSQISGRAAPTSKWNEDMPAMLYDPTDELTQEEREEVDPMMKASILEQGMNEFNNAKWPGLGSAIREVGLMVAVIAFTAVVIIGWDKLLKNLYTDIGFVPSPEDIKNYAAQFNGLDLPTGWTNNMSEDDVATLTDTVSSVNPSGGLPNLK
jgi:hypothetical protein